MKLESQLCLMFPTLIHQIESPSFKENDLVKFAYQAKRDDPKGLKYSNVGGWQSQSHYNKGDNILKETILNYLIEYFSTNRSLKEGIRLDVNSIWININKKGDYNILHTHPTTDLAGVLWIKVPAGAGNIEFNSPFYHTYFHEMSCYNDDFRKKWGMQTCCKYESVAGKMFVFPSSLYHRVEASQSNQDRISASFNINLLKS